MVPKQFGYFVALWLKHCLTLHLINLFETTFQREGTLYLACNDKIAFFTSDNQKNGLNYGLAKMLVTL